MIPESQVIALSEDDIGLFLHDKARLMVVLPIKFHVSYHSHGEANLLANDPVGYYEAIHKHIFGKRAVD